VCGGPAARKNVVKMGRGGTMRTPSVLALMLLAVPVCLPQSRSFTGEVMDSQCAGMRSHDKMMQGVDAKDARDCTQKCVKLGGKYVVFDPASKTAYMEDDQSKLADYAGRKVTVKGTMDASKTIHVESVEAQ
jgi:hypothetical protein